jgi:ABC-type cobalamin/Fe3+-siderophores transport system ATPase subunit
MTFVRFGMSLVGVVALLAATLAGATIWLVLTDPVTVVDAVSQDDITPLVRDLAAVLYEALQNLLRYL